MRMALWCISILIWNIFFKVAFAGDELKLYFGLLNKHFNCRVSLQCYFSLLHACYEIDVIIAEIFVYSFFALQFCLCCATIILVFFIFDMNTYAIVDRCRMNNIRSTWVIYMNAIVNHFYSGLLELICYFWLDYYLLDKKLRVVYFMQLWHYLIL
jgi:hypothetical protein